MSGANGPNDAALTIRYDAAADATYVRLRAGTVAEPLDVDAEGRPLGIGFVAASDLLPFLRRRGGKFVLPGRIGSSAVAPAAGVEP